MSRNRHKKQKSQKQHSVGGPMSTSTSPPKGNDKSDDHTGDSPHCSPLADSPSSKLGNPSTPPKHQNPNNHSSNLPWWRRAEPRGFIIQLLLLAVGIWVAKIYSCQLNQMIESNRINREALESVQRAFIFYDNTGAARVRTDNTKQSLHSWRFSPTIANSGTTAAIQAIQQFHIMAGLPNEPTGEMFRGDVAQNSTAMTIGPKQPQGVGRQNLDEFKIFGRELTENFDNFPTAKIQPGIFLWGWVVYQDVFFPNTRPHVMEYCQRLAEADYFPTNPLPKIGFVYANCTEHNCTDNQCKDYEEILGMVPYSAKK